MTKFSELTPRRQIAVQLLLEEYPECKETGTITLKQVRGWWHNKYSKQENRLCGSPIWIFSEQEFRTPVKGTYLIPVPAEGESANMTGAKKQVQKKQKTLKDLTKVKAKSTIEVRGDNTSTVSEDEFAEECRAAGITL